MTKTSPRRLPPVQPRICALVTCMALALSGHALAGQANPPPVSHPQPARVFVPQPSYSQQRYQQAVQQSQVNRALQQNQVEHQLRQHNNDMTRRPLGTPNSNAVQSDQARQAQDQLYQSRQRAAVRRYSEQLPITAPPASPPQVRSHDEAGSVPSGK